MARQTRDASLETRAARQRLAAQPKPYWRTLEEGLHLGYRKPRAGSGAWLMRVRNEAGAYRESGLGGADDFDDADSDVVLSYGQAQAAARAARIARERAALGLDQDARRGPYTVADAIADYTADFIRRGGKALSSVKGASSAHILPALGTVTLDRLTKDRIARWHAGLAAGHAMVRTGAGKARQHREHEATDADAVRRRRSTANRILTVLKAALNLAFAEGKVDSDSAWRRVKPFRSVDASRVRSLTASECSRLIAGCDPVFRPLASAALLTGCRYGELCRLRVADVDLIAQTVFIAESKSGKPRRVPLTDDGVALLRRLVACRQGSALVLMRDAYERPGRGRGNVLAPRGWKSSECIRFMERASVAAGLTPAVTFHELRHTYASLLVSAGVSLAFVAEVLGHADTRITSKHYAHLAPSSVATAIRGALPRFVNGDVTPAVAA